MLLATIAALAISGPKIGLAFGARSPLTEDDFLDSVREQIRLGVDGFALSFSWNDLHPDGKTLDLKKYNDQIGLGKFVGAETMITVKTIDTVNTTIPTTVLGQGWQELAAIAKPMWHDVSGLAPKNVKWFSLGNEVDIYLGAHPAEVDSYFRFLEAGRNAIREKRPNALVGVTVTWEGLRRRPALVKRLMAFGDVAVMTYYPLKDDFSPMPMTEVPSHIQQAVDAAGSKPLIFQEMGCPASPEVGSSEAIQSQFIKTVFAELQRHRMKIPLASFFMQVDFAPALLDFFETYYKSPDKRFRAFLGSLGLRKFDGTERSSLATFRSEMQRRSQGN